MAGLQLFRALQNKNVPYVGRGALAMALPGLFGAGANPNDPDIKAQLDAQYSKAGLPSPTATAAPPQAPAAPPQAASNGSGQLPWWMFGSDKPSVGATQPAQGSPWWLQYAQQPGASGGGPPPQQQAYAPQMPSQPDLAMAQADPMHMKTGGPSLIDTLMQVLKRNGDAAIARQS